MVEIKSRVTTAKRVVEVNRVTVEKSLYHQLHATMRWGNPQVAAEYRVMLNQLKAHEVTGVERRKAAAWGRLKSDVAAELASRQ